MVALASAAELATLMQRTFTVAETAAATLLLDIASDTIRTFTRQTLSPVAADSLEIDADGVFEFWLPERPVTALTSITIDGTLLSSTYYAWTQDGRIRFPHRLGYVGSDQRATIVYSHGFTMMPADIKGICLEMARAGLTTSDGRAVRSETVGPDSIEYNTDAAAVLSPSHQARLLPYRPPITSVPIVAGSW